MQNIPNRTEVGRQIREAFVAKPGHHFISLDYSQIELRLLAHESQDPVLLDSFRKGEDVHARTASEIFGSAIDKVDRRQRTIAKSINFGLLYGMGAHRLSQELGITRKDAAAYIETYFQRYASIKKWHESTLHQAHEKGEVRTLMGRRRTLPDLRAKNRMLVQRAERMAINTPIQGTAADLIKEAMIHTDRRLAESCPEARLILQVHDELVIECPTESVQRVKTIVADAMIHAADLSVPLVVEGSDGPNWAVAH